MENDTELSQRIWQSDPLSISEYDSDFKGLMLDLYYIFNDENQPPIETEDWKLAAHLIRTFIAYKYSKDVII